MRWHGQSGRSRAMNLNGCSPASAVNANSNSGPQRQVAAAGLEFVGAANAPCTQPGCRETRKQTRRHLISTEATCRGPDSSHRDFSSMAMTCGQLETSHLNLSCRDSEVCPADSKPGNRDSPENGVCVSGVGNRETKPRPPFQIVNIGSQTAFVACIAGHQTGSP